MMIKGKPCKVSEISVSKTGKHGHAKAHVFGNDIFTGKKYEDVFPTSHNVDAPFVKKFDGEVVDIDEDGFVSYLDEEGEVQEIGLPDGEDDAEMVEQLKAANDEDKNLAVNIISAMGESKIVGFRETKG
eukprot:TRINITY_DN3363_c0_g1_i3.p1 TRINITY_DN3363_c0_g1~~TRINITY_DN3363_c0_g1_i3.p1  ORF type:complete len:129 (+),score=33.07 TRINITY_DN3363_c0_g1_i3:98-484(+)